MNEKDKEYITRLTVEFMTLDDESKYESVRELYKCTEFDYKESVDFSGRLMKDKDVLKNKLDTLNKGIDELLKKYEEEIKLCYGRIKDYDTLYDNSYLRHTAKMEQEYMIKAFKKVIKDLREKLKGE